jgi:sporulation protein YlmC with PRC-barrel domain
MDTLLSVRRLHGSEVYDRRGDKLGVIEDVMLDIDHSAVRYAVLSFSTPLLTATKHFAVPISALHLDTENECFVLDAEKDRLDAAQGFDPDNPPVIPDSLFASPSSRRDPALPASGYGPTT